MLLRNIISEVNALRYLVEGMQMQSGPGKRYLLDTAMMHDSSPINKELKLVERIYNALSSDNKELVTKLQNKLMQIRDIRGSVKNVKSNLTLDDVELFEIKCFSLLSQEILELQKEFNTTFIDIPNLKEIITLLDPQDTKIPSFYIYDIYSDELAEVRKELKTLKSTADKEDPSAQKKLDDLFNKSQDIEAEIRQDICLQLNNHITKLETALDNIAHLDVIIAKAVLAKSYGLTKPEITEGTSTYTSMFNPLISDTLKEQGRSFQPIDINIEDSVCFITGANMAGKTVILRTLALCQYLLQFGFFVPASAAKISIVDKIMISIGDEQSEHSGLSSFASEMIKINKMVEESQKHHNVLILIDELARTTNPTEGRAIVNAVGEIFFNNKTRSVITTHYSGLNPHCRKLRVKGLDKDIKPGTINKDNINDFMDYSLTEDHVGTVPHEALRIASMLGINSEIIDKAHDQLDKVEQKKNNIH